MPQAERCRKARDSSFAALPGLRMIACVSRVIPPAAGEPHHASAYAVGYCRARKTGTARAEHPNHIALANAACLGIARR